MSNHPSWPSQTGQALSNIIDGSSAAPNSHPTGPLAGVVSSLSVQYGGNTYGPNNHPGPSNHPTAPAPVASSASAQYGPNNHPSGPAAGVAGTASALYGPNNHPSGPPAGVPSSVSAQYGAGPYGPSNHPTPPASVSSYFANSAYTTFGPSNHPTARPSDAPGGVSGAGGVPFGPAGPGGRGYPSWLKTASGTPSAGACPPATWSGWTQGNWATHPAWTAWAGTCDNDLILRMISNICSLLTRTFQDAPPLKPLLPCKQHSQSLLAAHRHQWPQSPRQW